MSRRGKNKKTNNPTVSIDPWANKILDHWAQGKAKVWGKKGIVEALITIFDAAGVHPAEFKDALDKMKKQLNAKKILMSGDCVAFTENELKDEYVCVWGRLNKPPQTKRIAKEPNDAKAFCNSCNKTKQLLAGIEDYEREIAGLRTRVEKGAIVDVPSCVRGGRISDDGKSLYCQNTARFSKVERCKTLRNGANCKDLRWTRIEMKGKLPDTKLKRA